MNYMVIHKTNDRWEAGEKPTPDLIAKVGKLIGEMIREGVLVAGDGLRATSLGVRVTFSGKKRSVKPGPFKGGNKVSVGFATIKVASLDEAVEHASAFSKVLGDIEVDIRPVTEAWDLGMVKPPENLSTRRYMALYKVDPEREAALHTPQTLTAIKGVVDDLSRAGVLVTSGIFGPSARGRRLRRATSRPTVIDGPFTESKELIAGFVMIRGDTIEDALRWVPRYLEVVDTNEVDVVEVF